MNSLRILPQKFIPIFMIKDGDSDQSLFDIFAELSSECETYLRTMEKSIADASDELKIELSLITSFVSFFKKIKKYVDTKKNQSTKIKL